MLYDFNQKYMDQDPIFIKKLLRKGEPVALIVLFT